MRKAALIAVVCVGMGLGLGAASPLVRFDGGIGVDPVSNVTVNADGSVTVSRNIVRGVNPPGQIWRIDSLAASVDVDGRISVKGQGLLLGGGNNIGLNANQSVFATLICNAAAPFTQHSTPTSGVPLDPNGDFRIDDVLDPPPPAECVSPVLLIRSAAGTNPWFAAGTLK
jgi:hypothetical protein